MMVNSQSFMLIDSKGHGVDKRSPGTGCQSWRLVPATILKRVTVVCIDESKSKMRLATLGYVVLLPLLGRWAGLLAHP